MYSCVQIDLGIWVTLGHIYALAQHHEFTCINVYIYAYLYFVVCVRSCNSYILMQTYTDIK